MTDMLNVDTDIDQKLEEERIAPTRLHKGTFFKIKKYCYAEVSDQIVIVGRERSPTS